MDKEKFKLKYSTLWSNCWKN